MKKLFILLFVIATASELSACSSILSQNELTLAVAQLEQDYDSINVLDMQFFVTIDRTSFSLHSILYSEENKIEQHTNLTLSSPRDSISEDLVTYYEEKDGKLLLYSPHPYDDTLYYVFEEMPDESTSFDSEYNFLTDVSEFKKTEDHLYKAQLTLNEISGFMDDYLKESLSDLGGIDVPSAAYDATIQISVSIDNGHIDEISFDFANFYKEIFESLYSDAIGTSETLSVKSIMTLKMSIQSDVHIVMPTRTIDGNLTDHTPLFEQYSKITGHLDFLYDQDNYRLTISDEGYYLFDVTDDTLISFNVEDPKNPTLFMNENALFSASSINSRVLYMQAGDYLVTVSSNSIETVELPYEIYVSKVLKPNDDYSWDIYCHSNVDPNILYFGYQTLENNYPGDVDTLYLSVFEMEDIIVRVPKGLVLIDTQNSYVFGSMETNDSIYYVIRFHNPDPIQRYTWTLSFLHDSTRSSTTIKIENAQHPMNYVPSQIGSLNLDSECILYAFDHDYFTFDVHSEGDYQFHIESSVDNPTFYTDFYTDSNGTHYAGSISAPYNMTIHLLPGRYYLFPRSNYSQLGIFKISVDKID